MVDRQLIKEARKRAKYGDQTTFKDCPGWFRSHNEKVKNTILKEDKK